MIARLRLRLASLVLHGPHAELIRHDLEDLYARERARGMSAPRALARYFRRLAESAFSVWRGEQLWLGGYGNSRQGSRGGSMLQDIRFAFRLFRKHPVPAGIAIGGLALAIGVVAAGFTLIDATLLKKHGMDDPDSVVSVGWAREPGWPYWSYSTFLKMRDEATLSRVEASESTEVRLDMSPSGDASSNRRTLFVSGGYLAMLGGRPEFGRSLQPADDAPGAPAVAVVSHQFWSSQLNRDPSIVGSTLWLNGSAVTLVGVLQPQFTGPVIAEMRPAIWAPLSLYDDVVGGPPLDASARTSVEVIARLAPGASVEAARQNLSVITSAPSSPTAKPGPSVRLYSAASPIVGWNAGDSLIFIASIAGIMVLVLAVACANTANLLLAAASTRMHEIGVRLALGAGTRRLARQMLNEGVLLALVAGSLGFLLAFWFVPVLVSVLSLPPDIAARPDWRALLFTTGVAVVCGLGASLSPARYGARGNVLAAVKAQDAGGQGRKSSWVRSSFLGFQAAVSMFLLVAATLLVRSALAVTRTNVGFDIDKLIAVSIERQPAEFDENAYFSAAIDAVRAVPSVENVTLTQHEPFGGSVDRDHLIHQGRSFELSSQHTDADYLATLGLQILRGRNFTPVEVTSDAPVALVSDSVARAMFKDSDPIGQSVSQVPAEGGVPRPDATIIGVVADAMLHPVRAQGSGSLYRPIDRKRVNPPSLLVRTRTSGQAVREITEALRRVNPKVRTSTSMVREGLDAFRGSSRTFAWLAAPVAILAFVLAGLGVFGVTAFLVSLRLKEVSLRIALGASSNQVMRLLVKDSLRPVIIGLVVGLAFAVAFNRIAASELTAIGRFDSPSVALAVSVLLAGALLAVLIPARRVAKADPATLLREV
jgi:predicted permease